MCGVILNGGLAKGVDEDGEGAAIHHNEVVELGVRLNWDPDLTRDEFMLRLVHKIKRSIMLT